jgi:hypothetical protein
MQSKLLKSSNILSTILKPYYDLQKNRQRQYGIDISDEPRSGGLKKLTDKFSRFHYSKLGFKKEDKPFIKSSYKKAMNNIAKGEGPYGKHKYSEVAPGFEQYANVSGKSKKLRERAVRKLNEKYEK